MVAEVHVRAPVEVREVLDPKGHVRHKARPERRGRPAHVERSAEERRHIGGYGDLLVIRRDALPREPRETLLHEIPAQEVVPGAARERDVRLERHGPARRHVRRELRALAFPDERAVRRERPPVVAEVDRVRSAGGPREVARVRDRDRHRCLRAAHPERGDAGRVGRAEAGDDRPGDVHREAAGHDALLAEPRDPFLHEVELERVVPARGRRRDRGVDGDALAAKKIGGQLRARAVPDDARPRGRRPVVAEVHRERVRDREGAPADVRDGDRDRRRLARRERGLRVERVARLEVEAHAGRRVVGRDALVGEGELVLFVEIEVHRVVRRVDRGGHREGERDRLTWLHIGRKRHLVGTGERVARRVAHPLVAELHRARAGRVPHAAAVVGDGDADDPRLARGPADRHVVGHPVGAPVGAAEVLVAPRRPVKAVPPDAVRLQVPAHDVVADPRGAERDVHRGRGARRDVRRHHADAALREHRVRSLQHAVRHPRAGGDARLALVHHVDGDVQRAARERGLRQVGLEVGHLHVALVHRVLRQRANRGELRVEGVARAGGLPAGLALDVVAVAVALDVRRVRGDVLPRAALRELLVGERIRAERLHAELRELRRDDVRDRADHGRRR